MNRKRGPRYYSDFLLLLLPALVAVITTLSCKNNSLEEDFYLPADFHTSESIGFVWTSDFAGIVPRLAAIISSKDQVTIYTQEGENHDEIRSILTKYNGNMNNMSLVKTSNLPENYWIRDFGPCYTVNPQGEKKIIDFAYYGKDYGFNNELASRNGLQLEKSRINSTGGARESNGNGTLLICESHENEANSRFTKAEIENEYKQKLNVRRIIWLKKGIPQDDNQANGPIFGEVYPNGLNGHIDEFCRFVNEKTVLISSVSDEDAQKHPIMAEAQKRLDENYEILKNSVDADGKKLNIIKVPFAPLFVFEEKTTETTRLFTYVTSYLNFIITNSFVIIPSYTSNVKDFNKQEYLMAEVKIKQIFENIYPNKEIVQVQATELNRYGGGFHCISINNPLAINQNKSY